MITIIGIDPGIVDTGAVALQIGADLKSWSVQYEKITGEDADAVARFVQKHGLGEVHTFIEKYRDRGNVFNTHAEMRALEHAIKKAVPGAKLIDNTGVKKVITIELMRLFGVYTFKTSTHHQDLRSAAYIALYGALKDARLNRILTDLVIDILWQGGEYV